jgi:hypothetical protein
MTFLKNVKTHTSLKPGQKGTKRLVEQYGKALICVRYRHDAKRGISMKTVEEKPFHPCLRYRDDDMVSVIVGYTETNLRDLLKKAGGRWDPLEKLWRVCFGAIRGNSELEERILKD